MAPHLFDCKNVTGGIMTLKQKWSHLIWLRTYWIKLSYDPKLWPVWPLPTIDLWWTFWPIWPVTAACDKIAHTMSPNHSGQILLPWASMPLMTPFHHTQFHCSIGMEVGQIFGWTFSNVSKIHDPSPLWLQNVTEGNMTPKQKWSQMIQDILAKTLIWPQIVTCATSAHNWPSTNFLANMTCNCSMWQNCSYSVP